MENDFVDQVAISRSISHVPPAQFLLKIEAFSSLVENDVENYESLEFDAGGYKKLVVYPNGNKKKNVKDHISLYLAMVDTSSLGLGWEVYVIFRLFVLDQNKDEFLILQELSVKERNKCKGECLSMTKLTSASNYKHVWKIENFSNHISMYLELADLSTITRGFKIYVHFTLRIRNQVQSIHNDCTTSDWFRTSIDNWGWHKFMELSYLNKAGNGFLVNDVCIVEAKVSVLGISDAL
ncbi:hypothetical protein CUMW_179940 [Citrus unshiu]|uniref:MATH domain-containing protein n=1 Tax=Citrus unshiu TaxID=55188 RepID=A0A2H5PYT4_CITUN|nr:hypothetical protein CUMW_179940 [Citrus unshiu]